MNKPDVIIVGGGVIGCAAAYYLQNKGTQVLLLERNEIGDGGSSRNGGGVRQSARDIRELPLAMYAVRNMWPGLADELGVDIEYCQQGNLRLGKTAEHQQVLQQLVEQGRAAGLDMVMLSAAQVKEICPYVAEAVTYASYCPTDGHANPLRTTLAFYKKARELGAEVITGEQVQSLLLYKGKVTGVVTDQGRYEAGAVIIAAGLDSRPIINSVGVDVPLQTSLIECLVSDAQPPMFPQMIGTAPADFYGHQTSHGSFVFGGSSGLEPYYANAEQPVSRPLTPPAICRAVLNYFPVLGRARIVRTWSGFLDKTPDLLPVISKVTDLPGLILACGFSGHGFGIAPVVGKLLSELAADEQPTLPLEFFAHDRFKPRL
ncbi:NAD(P)/FAD-dependent oxidoreductase [Sporomusa termitida]|uniref:Sarcosine oxidase subunit beta n=1 Tax=Sporomusa termitida TaxID=2377 RepID=A0A517DZ57_9FIRM|nr:FAD-binding oxidoreductase [Sporomusa termitida]QDR82647.1 Sarcosine oxidase subunit beta [Sporomusa termitida]